MIIFQKIGFYPQLLIVTGILLISIVLKGGIGIGIALIAAMFFPLSKNIRIFLILSLGFLQIFFLSKNLFFSETNLRINALQQIASEKGFEYEQDFNYQSIKNPDEFFPNYMGSNDYSICSTDSNLLRIIYKNVQTYIFDCKEKSNTNIQQESIDFTTVAFVIPPQSLPSFAIVNNYMKDINRLNVQASENNTNLSKKNDIPYIERPLVDNYSYLRNKYINSEELDFPTEIFSVVKNDGWFIESTGYAVHLHKRTNNGGILIEPEKIPDFIEEAYQVLQIIQQHPPTALSKS